MVILPHNQHLGAHYKAIQRKILPSWVFRLNKRPLSTKGITHFISKELDPAVKTFSIRVLLYTFDVSPTVQITEDHYTTLSGRKACLIWKHCNAVKNFSLRNNSVVYYKKLPPWQTRNCLLWVENEVICRMCFQSGRQSTWYKDIDIEVFKNELFYETEALLTSIQVCIILLNNQLSCRLYHCERTTTQ